jgi:formate C-acetyltransferase
MEGMMQPQIAVFSTLDQRIAALRDAKMAQTREKWQVIGAMDHDDWALVLPPPKAREVVQTISGSGVPITDVILKGFEVESNHPSGGFFGPRACGRNFRRLLEAHPAYIDPNSALAGAYMVNFMSYRKPHWNPDLSCAHLEPEQRRYRLIAGIGGTQHFCQDLAIGFAQGWGGILDRIRHYRGVNTGADAAAFYDGLEDVALGMQNWIRRHAEAAATLAASEPDPERRANLLAMAEINRRLVADPPRTFREACQWMLWFQMAARMYNGSGSLGRLDALLLPFYERDTAAGVLDDEEAIFILACLLARDTGYIQLGGPDASGADATNPVSFLALEAAHRLNIPSNIGVCVGNSTDPALLRRGLEVMFADKNGSPKFLGVDNTVSGFARNGYPIELARERAYSGCHWSAIPGREYTLNDMPKVNFAAIFDVALRDMLADPAIEPSVERLWARFEAHLHRAVAVLAEGFDFQIEHMHTVFPELVLDLLCLGPIERGLDASHGGVEFYNLCVDGAALATAADSFAAVEQRVEQEGRLTWAGLLRLLDTDWSGPDGERARLMMQHTPRYGAGGTRADVWAEQIAEAFTEAVVEKTTPAGYRMLPGLFSWALTIAMGRDVGATPNGRRARGPISHGPNPDPGFRKDGAPTALAAAVAAVQPGYGNAAPMQLDLDPGLSREEGGLEKVEALVRGHFALGGTQINLNVLDREKVLEAHRDPSAHPDLVVRVTGFSAYFASLSPEFRQMVVDRLIAE